MIITEVRIAGDYKGDKNFVNLYKPTANPSTIEVVTYTERDGEMRVSTVTVDAADLRAALDAIAPDTF
jgi:hypothetical protein